MKKRVENAAKYRIFFAIIEYNRFGFLILTSNKALCPKQIPIVR